MNHPQHDIHSAKNEINSNEHKLENSSLNIDSQLSEDKNKSQRPVFTWRQQQTREVVKNLQLI